MNRQLSLTLVFFAVIAALVVAGCGNSSDKIAVPQEATPAQSTAATGEGATGQGDSSSAGASGAVGQRLKASAEGVRNDCLAAAEKLPAGSDIDKAKQACETAYDRMLENSANVEQKLAEAQKNCEQQAKQIENSVARSTALDGCKRLR